MELSFFGAAQEVGRSCIMVSTDNTKVILDAGVKLGAKVEYPEIPAGTLRGVDAAIVSHAHLDHCGYLPHLYSDGYTGPVYATKPTIELTNVLINDYMRISKPEDISKAGLAQMSKSFRITDYNKVFKVNELTVKLIPAGHILGSALISISDGKQTVLYTGDINLAKTRLFPGADTRALAADTLITESTYGARKDVFKDEKEVLTQMLKSINATIQENGKVIIPSFAVGRAQEVLFILNDYMNSGTIPKVPIYVDGMINKAMRIHRHNVIFCRKEIQRRILMSDADPFKSENFVEVSKQNRSKVVSSGESGIIVTTSGMLTGGPVMHYISKLAHNPANKMMLVGYQALGTPGRALQEGAKELEIAGKKVKINMSMENYHLSAHADRPQLETLFGKVKGLSNLFIVHGEKSKSEELRADMAAKFNAVAPERGKDYSI